MKLEITFKSGAKVVVDSDYIGTVRNEMTGDLTRMKWNTPEDWTRKLHTISVDEIVCVVAIRSTVEEPVIDQKDETQV